MHTGIPPNGKPNNGGAPHGPVATQQPASAKSTSGASTPGAVPPTSPSPPAPKKSTVPPVMPPPKVSAAGDVLGKRPPAASAPTADKPKSAAEVKGESPAAASPQPKSSTRPYFYAAGIDLESFTVEMQSAIRVIVVPCYEQMVLGERNPMAKAIGAAFAAETAVKISIEIDLIAAMTSGTAEPVELERLMSRHDKSVKRLDLLAKLHLRIKTLQAKQGPLGNHL